MDQYGCPGEIVSPFGTTQISDVCAKSCPPSHTVKSEEPRKKPAPLKSDVTTASEFDGKVCYITGGTSGLGLAAVEAAAREGCKVVFTGRDKKSGMAIEKDLQERGGEVLFFPCDVAIASQVEESIKFTVNKFGSLDYAFNNAGIFDDAVVAPHLISLDTWRKTMSVNVDGVFHAVKYQVDTMLKLNVAGSIVNCGSVYSKISGVNGAAYAASKHALIGLTNTFALAYAEHGIRVNMLSPSLVETKLTSGLKFAEDKGVSTASNWHPRGRWLQQSEVVDALLFLWSSKSSFMNAHNLVLDSGMTASFIPPQTYRETYKEVGKVFKDTFGR